MALLFVFIGFNLAVTVFGYTLFWNLFPKDRMGAIQRQNADLKRMDSENNNTVLRTTEDRKCK
ncbi:DUF3149 domain-containing protein [Caenorhabditis elegans]|uniref:DUF3149 domain-containing protein n=2 Tax=Caenorhabditis elegans TaxID=6239 RepID=Q7YTP7_CAEEL|nr:DUF3149 domain-containing protein [Caenorhabditis elegans]CAE17772.1 DUF3149 domain-containing protein [Caenorhabditis elegans]|eukprot:NP_001256189.1 Uncharacterized protein CELE_C51E3.10 [Caenorhabditis elegans]